VCVGRPSLRTPLCLFGAAEVSKMACQNQSSRAWMLVHQQQLMLGCQLRSTTRPRHQRSTCWFVPLVTLPWSHSSLQMCNDAADCCQPLLAWQATVMDDNGGTLQVLRLGGCKMQNDHRSSPATASPAKSNDNRAGWRAFWPSTGQKHCKSNDNRAG